TEHRALLRDHALDRERPAPHAHALADGPRDVVEQLLGDIEPEDRHEAALAHVHVGERIARRDLVVLHDLIWGGDTEHERVAHGPVTPRDVGRWGGPPHLQSDRWRLRDGALHVGHVFGRDDGPPLDPPPLFVVDEPYLYRVAPDLERVHAHDRSGEPLPHVRVHALNHRHHGD